MADEKPTTNGESPEISAQKGKPSGTGKPFVPKNAGKQAIEGSGEGKGKSAKELKKEKRAALVASRGGPSGTSSEATGLESQGRSSTNETIHKGKGNASTLNQNAPTTNGSGSTSVPSTVTSVKTSTKSHPPTTTLLEASTSSTVPSHNSNLFFSHLPFPKPPNSVAAFESAKIHPLVVRLGVLMSSGTLRGANARTMGMMAAFQEVIRDYTCPDQAVLWKDLPIHLSPMISYLENCRPKGVGGGNAIRWLKSVINRLGEEGDLTENEQKSYLVNAIEIYIRDRIEFADQVIADHAKEKIRPGDVVVTYARSSIVEKVILGAWRDMRSKDSSATFEVIVVDSRPLYEGKNLLSTLRNADIPCTYTLLPLLSSILSRADLVLLGGSALHSDGALYSRCGTAVIAMMAKEHRVPVVACVETYKFGERVALDGVALNELGETSGLLDPSNQQGSGETDKTGSLSKNLTPLVLMYDLTPPSLITAVCTEIGFIPPSSVPTVLGKGSGIP